MELVAQYRRLVNGEVNMGRDSHNLRLLLDNDGLEPTQILLGFYRCKGHSTMTVPQILRIRDQWLVENIFENNILLAREIVGYTPPEWSTYWDLLDVGIESASLEQKWRSAKWELEQWADRILSQPVGRKIRSKIGE